jgi:hypothetical protein
MEKPGIIKVNRSRVKFIIIILLCSFLYAIYSCNSKTKSMETRGSVKGILKDESGKPVRDAIVMIVDGSSDFNDMASVSNDEGEFYISNVVIPGRYVLQIQGNDQQKRKEVNLSSTDTVIKITY